ncbi:MAG TPA: hypothetical protein DCQ98_00875 [Planctomycetaceae bacterium]|nr:hypothetical protein [Planctomycetaceae bacterium]
MIDVARPPERSNSSAEIGRSPAANRTTFSMLFPRRPLFSWRFELFPDSYGLDRASVWPGVRRAIERQQAQDDLVLLVTHFPTTYFELQELLDRWEIPHHVLRPGLNPADLPLRSVARNETGLREPAPVALALAEMLVADGGPIAIDRRRNVSVIVVERHPLSRHDLRLESFARRLPTRTRLGYFVALDDDAIGPFLGDWTLLLLDQFGMNRHELIVSDLISRRLFRSRRRLERLVRDETPCDSPRRWLEHHLAAGREAEMVRRWFERREAEGRTTERDSHASVVSRTSIDDDDEESESD